MLKNLPDKYLVRLLDREPRELNAEIELTIHNRLARFGLENLEDKNEIVELPIPDSFGTVWQELEKAYCEYNYRWEDMNRLVEANAPEFPTKWNVPIGWSKWIDGRWYSCPAPRGKTFILDCETVKVDEHDRWHPVCAVAMSSREWWAYRADLEKVYEVGTIPFGLNNNVIGYNIGYDRSYLDVEYLQTPSNNLFADLMSQWIVCRGMSNQQRTAYGSMDADDFGSPTWLGDTTTNGLSAVHEFYLGKPLDKSVRDGIEDATPSWIAAHFTEVLEYCAKDVLATHNVAKHLWYEYQNMRPSKVNRYGALALGSCWLPLDAERWSGFYDRVEAEYQALKQTINEQMLTACNDFLSKVEGNIPLAAQWLDWTPAKTGKNKGLPAWYREKVLPDYKAGKLTLSKRYAPLVLGMTWHNEPVLWDAEAEGYYTESVGFLPHPTEKDKKVTKMTLKDFLPLFESGFIGVPEAFKPLLSDMVSAINWVQMRKRVASVRTNAPEGFPVVAPDLLVNGTVTGRMAHRIWQVLPNPKQSRMGTELKTMVCAPDGYVLVGADVASQEAWLSGLYGDKQLGFNASTPFGAMNACGSSKDKTDIHSVVSRETGISRDITKNRVYGCLYGQGLKGDMDIILKNLPQTSAAEAKTISEKFLRLFKGERLREGGYKGGIASATFTALEQAADKKAPRTPLTGAYMSRSLAGVKDYKPTRVNWMVQASGVDFRDMLVLLQQHFFKALNVDGRLVMTIHDEIRCCVRNDHVLIAAYALQLAHLYVKAAFIEAFSLDNIPAGVAWFPEIDVDRYLRKNPLDPSQTPTQSGLDLGYTLTPKQLYDRLTSSSTSIP